MTQKRRLDLKGLINREQPLKFTFDGNSYTGYQGDTLASALLANNVMLVGRSFKYHRPRGIYTAGVEEPGAIVNVGDRAHAEPNTRATLVELYDGLQARSQGGWPSLRFDVLSVLSYLSALLPAGFYYKTFMNPPSLWMSYEKIIRRAASFAEAPQHNDPDCYSERYAHCDVLVVGAGPSGLMAALTASKAGARVILLDDQPVPGGSLLHDADSQIDSKSGMDWASDMVSELKAASNVTCLQRTMAVGYYDFNYLTALESVTGHLGTAGHKSSKPRYRLWHIRSRQVIVAAGAIERPLLFSNNDLLGVMMADAVEKYINRYAVLPGQKIILFTNNDSGYRCAVTATKAGAQVTVIDPRGESGENGWVARAKDANIDIRQGYVLVEAQGGQRVSMAEIAPVIDSSSARLTTGETSRLPCDLIAVAGGWTPTIHLYSQSGGKLVFDDKIGAFLPDEPSPISPACCAGSAAGAFSLGTCIAQGMTSGGEAAQKAGFSKPNIKQPSVSGLDTDNIQTLHFLPAKRQKTGLRSKILVDLMNDVSDEDILLAEREGYGSVEHMKRYTAAGFGTDQGKTGNVNALRILADAKGVSPKEIGHTTFRPQYVPVPFGALAGRRTGSTFMQSRKTPMHSWHDAHGAVYEDVGDWRRPRYFTTTGESMYDAVQRECKSLRAGVGMLDASTLGKIDIQGPDTARFLDMMYTNMFSTLKIGHGRYGIMLNENGMLMDDGVTFRLGENHFHMTTTTGGAGSVMNWLERWLQTEWPEMKVWCTSVTEQWAVMSLSGPRSRNLLAELTDQPLDNDSFPFMTYRDCQVAGVPARIFRVSFTGEVGFEINVPSNQALHVWERIVDFGGAHNLTPYGTESMHVLRAEKGFIIVGQDSDGTLTPHDMGLSWMVSKKKDDFIGKRSLSRPDTTRENRRQLVGLLTDDPSKIVPEGHHLVESSSLHTPANIQGNVTSSYMSPTLGRSIAFAMVVNGRQRHGEQLYASDGGDDAIPAKVCEPIFYDKEGEKLRG